MVVLDVRGKVVLLNRRGCDILEYDDTELIGVDWFRTCLPIRDSGQLRQIFNDTLTIQKKSIEENEGFNRH